MRVTSVRQTLAAILVAWMGAWEVSAVPEVSSREDLLSLERLVQEVVANVTPATVSLFSTAPNGASGSGSGVVVSEEGLVLTASHVVDGFDEVVAVFPSGEQVQARVLGANRNNDEAMVQLLGERATPWPTVKMGDSDAAKVGDFVIALGHAGGFDALRPPPVRFGRILGRNSFDYLVTDCTLIGGDSGGPLFDLQGRLIAIHSSIGPELSSNNHRGVSDFVRDWDALVDGKTWGTLTLNPLMNPERPVIGFAVEGEGRGGVLVGMVAPNSPAALAGLRIGDVVREVDGQRVRSFKELLTIVGRHGPGEEIEITYIRSGRARTRTLTLARLGDIWEEE